MAVLISSAMKIDIKKRILFQTILVLLAATCAIGLRAVAFSDTSSTPPSGGSATAAIDTSANSQDKSALTHDAWITADGLGSRYTSSFATISRSVGVGVTSPGVELDVAQGGAVRVGNVTLSSGENNIANLATNAWLSSNGSSWNVSGIGALIQLAGESIGFWRHDAAGNFWITGYIDQWGNTVGHNFCQVGGACGVYANAWQVTYNTRNGNNWSDPCLSFDIIVSGGIVYSMYGDYYHGGGYCG